MKETDTGKTKEQRISFDKAILNFFVFVHYLL